MKMRKFTKLLLLFTLCLVGIQGNAQNVTIRGNNGSMIASVPNSGTEYDTFFKVGGFATWQHEQLNMVLTASDFTTLTSFGQLSNPANNLFSDGTHLQIGKGQGDYNKCYLSLSLPKGYRFTGYSIVFSKSGQTTKRLGNNTADFNTANATSRFGETNSSFAFTNYKDVARGAQQTITRTSNSATDMGNVLYFSLQQPDGSRALITLESAEFYFTAEANYTPLTAVGTVNRMSAVDIPFLTSKVDYGPIEKNTYNGASRLSYRSSNVKDLQANLTLYEAGSTKPGTDFDGTTGQVIDYKVGSISVEDGFYRIGAADASNPGTEEHVYYIETPSNVLLSDNATKNPIGYRIVGAKIDYKYGKTNVYGTETKKYPTFYFRFNFLFSSYYLNANGGTTTTSDDRAEWFQDDEGYIRTGANGYIYLTDKGTIMGGSRYPSTTTNKADAIKFNPIGSDGYLSYTENGNNYWLRESNILFFWRLYRFQNNTGSRVSRTLTGSQIEVNVEDDVVATHTEPYILKVYDATGESAQVVEVNSSNPSGSVYVNNMNNDAVKIGVIGTGLIQGALTLQALDPYLDQMKVVCTDPQVANEGGLRVTQNFTASDFSVNGGEFHFSLPTECNTHTVKITFEDLYSKYFDDTYDRGSADHNSRINFVKSDHYNAFGTANNNVNSNKAEAANATKERLKVGTVGSAKFKFNNVADLSNSDGGFITEYPFTLENYNGSFGDMTFRVSAQDQNKTGYVFTTDETRYNIAPTTAIQHRSYAFYEMKVHVQSTTYTPSVEFKKIYTATDYDNSAEGGSIDQNDVFYGAVVTANNGGKPGYASTASIYKAINAAIAGGGDVPQSTKQILYLDYRGMAGILELTGGEQEEVEFSAAPNCLTFLPKGSTSSVDNVAYETEAGTFRAAHNIVITDKQPFFSPYDIHVDAANYATYTRLITRPENGVVAKATLILPYALTISEGVHTNADGKSQFSLNTMRDNQNFSQAPSSVDHPSATFDPISGEMSEANKPYTVIVLKCEEDEDGLSFVARQYGATITATPKSGDLGQIVFTNETASGNFTNGKNVTTAYTCTSQGSFAGIIYDRAVSENVFYFAANKFLNLHTLAKAQGQYLYMYPFRSAYTYPDGGTGSNLLHFFDINFEGTLGNTDAITEMPRYVDLAVKTGKGYISMNSAIDQTVTVRSLSGMTVGEVYLRAGDRKSIELPAGIYVVNNVKIIVK